MTLMQTVTRSILALSMTVMVVGAAQAEGSNKALEKDDNSGPYYRGAFAMALPTIDPKPSPAAGTQFGFTMALGYEFFPLLQAELEGGWQGGKAIDGGSVNAGNWSLIANARAFPLGLFDSTSDFPLQPYALMGMGGGGVSGGSVSRGSFIFNLGVGADLNIGKNFGLYGEVAQRFHAGSSLPSAFKGITNFNFGVIKRF